MRRIRLTHTTRVWMFWYVPPSLGSRVWIVSPAEAVSAEQARHRARAVHGGVEGAYTCRAGKASGHVIASRCVWKGTEGTDMPC
eukprot:364728-Chlamydomonas_euryale.AAC.2